MTTQISVDTRHIYNMIPPEKGVFDIMKGIRKNTKDGYEVTVYSPLYGTVHIYHDKNGKRITEARRAVAVRSKILDEIAENRFDISEWKPKRLKELLFKNAYHTWLEEVEIAPTTLKNYRNYGRAFIAELGEIPVSDIKASDIRKICKTLGLSAKTKNNIMSILRSFFKWLFENEDIKKIPAFPKWKRVDYKYRRTCTWEVLLDIVSDMGQMEQEAILTMKFQWLRTGEVRALRWEDFLWERDRIIIRNSFSGNTFRETTKTGDWQEIHLHSYVKEILWARKGLPKAWVFHKRGRPLSESWLRKCFDKERDKKGYSKELTMYGATRHSAATEGYISTEDIYQVKKALRHKDIKATLKYTHYDSTAEIMEPRGDVVELRKK